MFDTDGKFVREVEFPGLGTATGFAGKRSDGETFYSFTSFTTPATVYRYDVATGKSTVFRKPKVDFDPADYETKQVFYASKDGTKIPMFVSHKKGLKLDGKNPTYLYGYGGFNIPLTPTFSPSSLVWMELGGRLRGAQPAGRRRVRRGLAPGGDEAQEAERLRRLHRRRRLADRPQVHVDPQARHRRRLERRPARRRLPHAAARPLRRGAAGGRA